MRNWHDKLNFVTAELYESPKEMPDMDFGLSDTGESKRRFGLLRSGESCKKIGEFKGLDIFEADDSVGKHFIFTGGNPEQDRLSYCVTWEDRAFPGSRVEYVTQIAVARNKVFTPPGLSAYVFWNCLYPKHHAIMTDNAQTRLGRSFWQNQVYTAIDTGIPVYFVDLSKPEAIPVRDHDGYLSVVDTIYGRTERHKDLRLLITDKPLKIPVVEHVRTKENLPLFM